MKSINQIQTIFNVCDAQGIYHAIPADNLISAAQKAITERFQSRTALTSPQAAADLCQLLLGTLEHEEFFAIWLDAKHQVITYGSLFRGTIDGASVYPREVVKDGLASNAAAVIFAHNHPSGNAEPSQADIQITQKLKDALALVDIRLLDHIIVAESIVSLAEKGLV